jgi:hypothetical protein
MKVVGKKASSELCSGGHISGADGPAQCPPWALRELGVFIPVGARNVVPAVWSLVEDAESDLPEALRPFFAEACSGRSKPG